MKDSNPYLEQCRQKNEELIKTIFALDFLLQNSNDSSLA